MTEVNVNEKHYIEVLEQELQLKSKENFMLKAYLKQIDEENAKLIEMYNDSQNSKEPTEETDGEKEGE